MRKKATAILLILTMTATLFGGTLCAAEVSHKEIQQAVTAASSMSAADRKSITDALIPLLITNTGLDALGYYINAYDPSSNRIFDVAVGKILAFTDKETALSMLGYLRCIDESIREDYLMGFKKRTELKLSENAQSAMEALMQQQFASYDGLEKLCTEDLITPGVAARMLESVYKMNGSQPILTDGNGGFGVYVVSNELRATIAKANEAGADVDADEFASGIVQLLNDGFSAKERQNLKTALGEIGIYKKNPENPSQGAGGAIATPAPANDDGQRRVGYEILESDTEAGYDILDISIYEGNKKAENQAFDKPQTMAIKVSSEAAMLYRITDGGLEAVKYTSYDNGELKCRIDASGKYALRIIAPYFHDIDGWGANYIEALYNRGVINGKGDNMFVPDDFITREEFVKLVVETAGVALGGDESGYSDVISGQWYEKYIVAASENGIANGIGDGKFGVGELITRQDMSKMLYSLLAREGMISKDIAEFEFKDAAEIAQYAREAVFSLVRAGILSGDDSGRFLPQNNATRREAAKLIYMMLALYVNR